MSGNSERGIRNEADWRNLGRSVGTLHARPEILDRHRASQVFSITHDGKPTTAADLPHAYEFRPLGTRVGYDAARLADL